MIHLSKHNAKALRNALRQGASVFGIACFLCFSTITHAQNSEELPLTGPAYQIAAEAYAAFDQKDYAKAISKAREAIRQRPDVARLKLLLLMALEASGQVQTAFNEAESFVAEGNADPALNRQLTYLRQRLTQTAGEKKLVPVQPETAPAQANPAYEAANNAYQAYKNKDWQQAITTAREAHRLAPNNREYHKLLINTLIAAGSVAQAEQEISLELKRYGNDLELLKERGYLRQKQRRYGDAADDFAKALRLAPSVNEARSLRLALADAAYSAKQYQRALDALAFLAGEKSYDVLMRRGYALVGLEKRAEAVQNFAEAEQLASSAAKRDIALSARIGLLSELGEKEKARELFEASYNTGKLKTLKEIDEAYLAAQAGNNRIANELFQDLDNQGKVKGRALLDAAYAAKREANNQRAIGFLHRAIDAYEMGEITLEPQYLFGLRRETADLSRQWGAYSSVFHGGVGVAPGSSFAPPSGGSSTQTVQEIYWRPPGIGYRNGAIFELFARGVATLHDDTDGPVGFSTLQGSVGARWKPFSEYNVIFEASRLFPIGNYSRHDVLLRVSFSQGQGTDLRVDVPSWWMWQVYGELGRYLQTSNNIANFQAKAGHSFRLDWLSKNLVLTPFVAVGGSYDNSLATVWAWSSGPGVNVRYWFREDKYRAPMSYLDVNVEYRFKLGGDDRAKGLFASATLAY